MKSSRHGFFGTSIWASPDMRVVIVVLALGAAACGGKGNPTGPGGGGPGFGSPGGGSPSPGTMTASIDGVAWTGTITVASIAAGNSLVVSGTGIPAMTTIAIAAPAQTGTHVVGFNNPATGTLSNPPALQNWIAAGPTGSGSITISTLTATSATGTFNFVVVPSLGGGNRAITNGAFNARLPTP